ncbi:hypothetical protein HC031_07745 [Planosporangium thailandense]|uniref:Transmembrane protein n=1 Tax=Planosporangium thailandense TaxID=765197 RepID=A0ABX0XWE2_9ACTN|nr:hypothetical protein [Planosporangium thailandense]NJC69612.1 hypothetical protein [Planosporangium thailandense]
MQATRQYIRVARSPWRRGLLAVNVAATGAIVAVPVLIVIDPAFRVDAASVAMVAVLVAIAVFAALWVPTHLRAMITQPRIWLDGDCLVLHDPALFRRDEPISRADIRYVRRFDGDWGEKLLSCRLSPFRERATVAVRFAHPRRFPAARFSLYSNAVWSYSRRLLPPIPLPMATVNYSGFTFRAADQDEAIVLLRSWLERG